MKTQNKNKTMGFEFYVSKEGYNCISQTIAENESVIILSDMDLQNLANVLEDVIVDRIVKDAERILGKKLKF